MRPLKLMMQAFGPYADKEEIDFTLLGSRTMFVISGKTGSGKTTIFDGISYAIYGKASGEDRNGSDLRSHFASDELPTEVALEFTLRNKIYYIKRSPQQEKKKDRGDGYTTIGAKAELYVNDQSGNRQLVAANVRDVDIKIKEIMLIDSNQFRQILMIPQGEFRKLLTSDSKEKEIILQRLFHTEIYKHIEEKLKEEATELKNSVEMQTNDRNQAIRNIQVLFHDELKGLLDEGNTNDTMIIPLLKDEINLSTLELGRLKTEAGEKEKERGKLQQQLFEAEALMKQLKTKDELTAKKAKLEQENHLIEEKEQSVVLAQKALVLIQQEELCHRLKKELDEEKGNLAELATKITSLTKSHAECENTMNREKEREIERSQALEHVNQLKHMEEDVRSISLFRHEVDLLQKKLQIKSMEKKKKEEKNKEVENEIQKFSVEKQKLEKEQPTFFENKLKMDKLEREYNLLVKFEKQQNEYNKASLDLQDKAAFYKHSQARFEDAKLVVQELEVKWLHGQAAFLANKLKDEESCPVCGSTHHPNPAVSQLGDLPIEEDIKAAKQQASDLDAEMRKAESTLYEAQSMEKSLEKELNDVFNDIVEGRSDFVVHELDLVKNTVEEEKNQLFTTQKILEKNKQKLDRIREWLEKQETEVLLRSEQMDHITKEVNDLTIQYTEKNTLLVQMNNNIPEKLQNISAFEDELQKAVHQYNELIERFDRVKQNFQQINEALVMEKARYDEIERQVHTSDRKLTTEREAFVSKMTEQGFNGFTTYHQAKMSEQEIHSLQQEVRSYREEYRSVSDRLHELTNLLIGIQEPDVSSLNIAFENMNHVIQELQNRYTHLFVRISENEKIVVKIETINSEIKSLEEKYQLIGHLYEMSKGQNTYRITFERYVLASFLDDILREANQRLGKMTNGRYQLLRKTDRSKGNVQSGLELLVFDQYTGQERHVKTLSGGESFKAALSLALGLADIVQQYAGGVSLETMFIDEGFGTLDPESLDQSIEALIDIQSSGRLVGIISHVPELKERIDARLEVVATKSGSTTEFHFIN